MAKKPQPTENSYIRLSENAKPEKFTEIGKEVNNGVLEWSHFSIDGNIGYHYYKKK